MGPVWFAQWLSWRLIQAAALAVFVALDR